MKSKFYSSKILDILPQPIIMGLYELEHNFQKMKFSLFADEQFVTHIESAIKAFANVLEETLGRNGNRELVFQQIGSIEDAIEFINRAISNRLHASRYLFEAKTFNPLNIEAFSKLNLYYESFIDLFERMIARYNSNLSDDGEASRLIFLVDISVHSSVNAKLFLPVVQERNPLTQLIGITINESSFFNIKDTTRMLLHEIGHHVSPYNREIRNKLVKRMLFQLFCNRIYQNLNSLLYDEILHEMEVLDNEEEKAGFLQVYEHFRLKVNPILHNIIYSALKSHFYKYLISEQKLNEDNIDELYTSPLIYFETILQDWIEGLNLELRKKLHLGDKEITRLEQLITDQIHQNIKKGESFSDDNKTNSRNHLYSQSNSLFSKGNFFEYKEGLGNVERKHKLAFKAYIDSLSYLGLNEQSKKNISHLVGKIMTILIVSLDWIRDENVLQEIVLDLEESLADVFMIQALDIKDIVSYHELLESFSISLNYTEVKKISLFGRRNAIITEYFSIRNDKDPPSLSDYIFPPLLFNDDFDYGEKEKIIESSRALFFSPIAKYLADTDNLFPEKLLFQQNRDKDAKEDIELLNRFRELFRHYYDVFEDEHKRFEYELHLIDLFQTPK